MISDVVGVRVGHWTDSEAMTGCTVIVLPEGSTASGEIRGGAPATREFGLLEPGRTVQGVDAVVLSGGSAFGLSAADGVVAGLAAEGRGFKTRHATVPIVVAMALYDLDVGDGNVHPGSLQGLSAFEAAVTAPHADVGVGLVGAGTGATVAKWSGNPRPGGLGAATVAVHSAGQVPVDDSVVVSALVAVNAFGSIDDGSEPDPGPPAGAPFGNGTSGPGGTNTTIGCVATNARLDKLGCQYLARAGHNGLARSLSPAHTAADGDALVAASTGAVAVDDPAALVYLGLLAQQAVTAAVRSLA